MTTLATARLLMRPLEDDDLDALAGFYADPEVMRHVATGEPRTREQTAESLARMREFFADHGYGQWAVIDRESGTFLGRAGIVDWPDVGGRAETEVGYLLGRAHWGRGYATEAALAARDHALETLGVRRLVSLIRPENERSAAVARRLGMTHHDDVEFLGSVACRFVLER